MSTVTLPPLIWTRDPDDRPLLSWPEPPQMTNMEMMNVATTIHITHLSDLTFLRMVFNMMGTSMELG